MEYNRDLAALTTVKLVADDVQCREFNRFMAWLQDGAYFAVQPDWEAIPVELITDPEQAAALANDDLYDAQYALENRWSQAVHKIHGQIRPGFAYARPPKQPAKLTPEGSDFANLIRSGTEQFSRRMCALPPVGSEVRLLSYAERWLIIIGLRTIVDDGASGMERSLWQVIRMGYLPITWRGAWPDGHAIAYCRPDLPQAQLPAACRPTRAQLKPRRRAVRRPRTRAIPVVPMETWPDRSTPDAAAAFVRHFATLASSDADRARLHAIAKRVTGFRREGRLIVLIGGRRRPLELKCLQPYTGDIARIPRSIAQVMRLHDGMILMEPGGLHGDHVMVEWFGYDGERFDVDLTDWNIPDPERPGEPLSDPQVPIQTGDGLFLVHPTANRPNGEAALVHMDSLMGEPMDLDAGSLFLQILAGHICDLDRFGRVQDGT